MHPLASPRLRAWKVGQYLFSRQGISPGALKFLQKSHLAGTRHHLKPRVRVDMLVDTNNILMYLP